jgi:hypothetical protein
MDDTKPFGPAHVLPETDTPAPADFTGPRSAPDSPAPVEGGTPPAPLNASQPVPSLSPAVEKFKSCRWRATPEDGEFCTHRDVLPFAGKEGFNADSWCPECAFYKLRRTPKKRERVDYSY